MAVTNWIYSDMDGGRSEPKSINYGLPDIHRSARNAMSCNPTIECFHMIGAKSQTHDDGFVVKQ